MKYTGKLDFNINGEYAIYTGDKYIPISSILDGMLGDEVKVKILNKNNKELFKDQGILLREKLTTEGNDKSNLYTYRKWQGNCQALACAEELPNIRK
ncbi:hypothetical protein CLOHAE12215_01344 [Clostridium haemolyticum]|uniref:hypothetical protein n=1 Tax=Clostridium haemolyticum TaxID=84025 RepID=UPI001C3B5CE7|nr:hypothetical protein [Clostridium haemolyticum]CAG7839928.1 hypothetical protein CLOHAE12215_01344 [Clostridium haemolyticum]